MISEDTRGALDSDLECYGRAIDNHERLWIFDSMVNTVYERELDLDFPQATEAVRELIRREYA